MRLDASTHGREALINIPYRRRTARAWVVYTVEATCYADPVLFQPWEQLSKAQHDEFEVHGPIPCDGDGVPGG